MAGSVLLGILSGLGNIGQQQGEARQIADAEKIRNDKAAMDLLAAQDQSKTRAIQQKEAQQRLDLGAQTLRQNQQKRMIGQPYTVAGGKQMAYFQDPNTGATTFEEVSGAAPETNEQSMYRGLTGIGISPNDAAQAVVKKISGRTATRAVTEPDASSPTGYSTVVYDSATGEKLWSAEALAPMRLTPTETSRTSTDQYGNTTTSTSVRRPIGNGGPQSPAAPSVPSGGVNPRPAPQAPQPAPVASQGGVSIGTYRGLDPQGTIPDRAGVNPQVREFANQILQGGDINKIPAKARGAAESLARAYGWKGQGSLTPGQQMQIEQVDQSLNVLSDPKLLKLFDSTTAKLLMSSIPVDPTNEGGLKGVQAMASRGMMSQDEAQYMNALTRLRGVITGIRGFTGANNSNATAERLLAELPTFTNTKNSRDALDKIQRLKQEVSIIKRLGYFLPENASPNSSAPSVGQRVEVP